MFTQVFSFFFFFANWLRFFFLLFVVARNSICLCMLCFVSTY